MMITSLSNVKSSTLQQINIIVLGDTNTGKSSIIMRYCEHKFKDNYVATIGIDFLRKSTENFKISVWDMAGREI